MFLFKFSASQRNFVSIDYDDVVAHVHMRCKSGLVLAAQQRCHLAGKASWHHISGVNDVPLTINVVWRGCKRTHYVLAFVCRCWVSKRTRSREKEQRDLAVKLTVQVRYTS